MRFSKVLTILGKCFALGAMASAGMLYQTLTESAPSPRTPAHNPPPSPPDDEKLVTFACAVGGALLDHERLTFEALLKAPMDPEARRALDNQSYRTISFMSSLPH